MLDPGRESTGEDAGTPAGDSADPPAFEGGGGAGRERGFSSLSPLVRVGEQVTTAVRGRNLINCVLGLVYRLL